MQFSQKKIYHIVEAVIVFFTSHEKSHAYYLCLSVNKFFVQCENVKEQEISGPHVLNDVSSNRTNLFAGHVSITF